MATTHFYQEIPSFSKFSGIVEEEHFHRVPSDWKVIITDVKGSTKAIEAGRYKDVNTVGAAAIACVQNVMGDLHFPFVFGGDGATLLVPPSHFEKVARELIALKNLAQETFSLGLRVGVVDVAELEQANAEILVAKYELVPGKAVAIFHGGGVTVAEQKVKESQDYELTDESTAKANLDGLSCRWKPIPSRNGKILSLLVVARSETSSAAYRDVLSSLEDIYNGEMEQANPVNVEAMQYRSFGECLQDERRYHRSRLSLGYLFRVVEIFLAVLVFRFKVPGIYFSSKRYTASMATHSDYRKFDDALRMIMDCSATQATRIQEKLQALHDADQIYFGVHESDNSLMTCYVNSVSEGNHIHFVDGGNGGYAMAAKQLKDQMRRQAVA